MHVAADGAADGAEELTELELEEREALHPHKKAGVPASKGTPTKKEVPHGKAHKKAAAKPAAHDAVVHLKVRIPDEMCLPEFECL